MKEHRLLPERVRFLKESGDGALRSSHAHWISINLARELVEDFAAEFAWFAA
jgi:hypothetical protein